MLRKMARKFAVKQRLGIPRVAALGLRAESDKR